MTTEWIYSVKLPIAEPRQPLSFQRFAGSVWSVDDGCIFLNSCVKDNGEDDADGRDDQGQQGEIGQILRVHLTQTVSSLREDQQGDAVDENIGDDVESESGGFQ